MRDASTSSTYPARAVSAGMVCLMSLPSRRHRRQGDVWGEVAKHLGVAAAGGQAAAEAIGALDRVVVAERFKLRAVEADGLELSSHDGADVLRPAVFRHRGPHLVAAQLGGGV